MTYKLKLWTRNASGHHFEVTDERTGGDKQWAAKCAVDLLRPHRIEVTRYTYHRDLARAPWVDVYDASGALCLTLTLEDCGLVSLVPSVGELGWSP